MSKEEQVRAITQQTWKIAMARYIRSLDVKTVDFFLRQLWGACLNYFREDIDAFDFVDVVTSSIATQLTRAWNEGARAVGVEPSDMDEEDHNQLQGIINNEYEFILGLAEDIDQARRDGLDRESFSSRFRSRIEIWANRYNETVSRAKVWFGGKIRLKWTLGLTEEHCSTCLQLNGIVAQAIEWETSGIRPQNPPNPVLECKGYHCDCSLEVTKDRRSPDALDRLMNIAAGANL